MTTIPELPQTPGADSAAPVTRAEARARSAHTAQPEAPAPETTAPLRAEDPAQSGAAPAAQAGAAPVQPESAVSASSDTAASATVEAATPAPAHTVPAAAGVLDDGTYSVLRTPTGRGALALDGTWHQISPKFVVAEVILRVLLLAVIVAAAAAATTFLAQPWPWAWTVGGVIALMILIALVILPRQARAIGYMLRADDIVFRRGILWQRMIAVPYGRMQLVDITRGPVDRAFGIAKLKLVTAAATTGVEIPGMTVDAAESLRDTLIDVAEMRRTGL